VKYKALELEKTLFMALKTNFCQGIYAIENCISSVFAMLFLQSQQEQLHGVV
jgi:hypothetical protein